MAFGCHQSRRPSAWSEVYSHRQAEDLTACQRHRIKTRRPCLEWRESGAMVPCGTGKGLVRIDDYRRDAMAAGTRLRTVRTCSPQLSPMRKVAGNSRSFPAVASARNPSRMIWTAAAPIAYPGCST